MRTRCVPHQGSRDVKPIELFDACVDAVARWKSGEQIADVPTVMLVIPRDTCPRGDSIRLMGRTGPTGRVCTVKQRPDGLLDIAASFPAVPILRLIEREVTRLNG